MMAETFMKADKSNRSRVLLEMAKGYLDHDLPLISNLSNLSALIKVYYPELNWVGFYLYDHPRLYLGPFQGLPACTSIALGKGVCGTSAQTRKTLNVPKTEAFPGHIVCDSQSRSELVVPIVRDDTLIGVLDLDSPEENHFTEADEQCFEQLVNLLIDFC